MSDHVLIIIIHFGKLDDTRECLRSLLAAELGAATILVLDSGSDSQVATLLQEEFPTVRTESAGGNLGFAHANNVGIKIGLAEGFAYSLLLNNDTIVDPAFLVRLREAMEDSQIAMAGPLMPFHSNPERVWAFGGKVYRWWAHIGPNRRLPAVASEPVDVDYLPGACMLVRNSVLKNIGLMPAEYFLGFEEAQFCLAARRQGFRVVACMNSVVIHKVGMSHDHQPKYRYNAFRNRFLFARYLFGRVIGSLISAGVSLAWLARRPGDAAILAAAIRDHFRYPTIRREHLLAFDASYKRPASAVSLCPR